MAQVSDAFPVLQALYRFTQAQDRLDLATMESILASDRDIEFDLSRHFPHVGVLRGNAAEMSNILYEASAGWTATQHPMYNPVVTFNAATPSKATVEAMVQAYHSLETNGTVDSLTVRATWVVDMEKMGADWFITRMSMMRDIPIANLDLFERMQEQVGLGNKRQAKTQPKS